MIEVKNLTKQYGAVTAVKDISFTVETGKIYGLLGPNGAGKSTTMNIITGCLAATSGTVLINGHDIFEEPAEAKKHIGYLPELPPVYEEMTPAEYLLFVAEAKKVPYDKIARQIRDIMSLTGLTGVRDRLIRNLSKGYRQRVGIAQAMIGDPEIIILDEPTVGLDPKQIIEIRELIRQLGRFKTVIISSHILAEIAEISDHILIISEGRLVADSPLDEMEENAVSEQGLVVRVGAAEAEAAPVFASLSGIRAEIESYENGVLTARFRPDGKISGEELRIRVACALAEAKIPVFEISFPTLESIFLGLTQTAAAPAEETDEPRRRKLSFSGFAGKKNADGRPSKSGQADDDYTDLFSSSEDDEEEDADEIAAEDGEAAPAAESSDSTESSEKEDIEK